MSSPRWVLITNLCPLAAQFGLLTVAIFQRNWMFMAMIIPGALMGITTGFSAVGQYQAEKQAAKLEKHASGESSPSLSAPSYPEKSDIHLTSLPSYSLLQLQHGELTLEPAQNCTPASWKTIVASWLGSTKVHDMEVSVGVEESSDSPSEIRAFSLDLKAQGPHALVAGTTGSGKSVFLQSWCTAMAMNHSPRKLQFIFLDFKGGATFHTLHQLPHVVGFVSDLNLAHAKRALSAIERELRRREALVAAAGVSTFDELDEPPPRLVVVVDEFQALRFSLPDYIEHLSRLASQGRSLGMNLILATQNPSGQVNGTMRANINLTVCLRVQDRMQSIEMLGTGLAAQLPAREPGSALLAHSGELWAFRSATVNNEKEIIEQCMRASKFCGIASPQPLFTPPLPTHIERNNSARHIANSTHPSSSAAGSTHVISIGVADDGVLVHPCEINLADGNIAIIGPAKRGKTVLAQNIAHSLMRRGIAVRWTMRTDQGYLDSKPPHNSRNRTVASSRSSSIWIIDGADELLDPLSLQPLHSEFSEALSSKNCRVIFTAKTAKHVHYPDQCSTRIIFPAADPTANVMSGIPASLLKELGPLDFETAGRAVLIEGPRACTIQCFT